MGHYTVIKASKEQGEALYEKHLKPFLGIIPRVTIKNYSYDSEDEIGFVTLCTYKGKRISYRLIGDWVSCIEFTGFGNIRYDISYPSKEHEEMVKLLIKYGKQARGRFWQGGQI